MNDKFDLKTRKTLIFITGAGKGFGRACALSSGAMFHNDSLLMICGRNEINLQETKSAVNKINPTITVQMFILDLETVTDNKIKLVITDLLPLEKIKFECFIIIHNAGVLGDVTKCSYQFTDHAEIDAFTNVNMTGTIIVNNVIMDHIRQSSSIIQNTEALIFLVNVSSLAAVQTFASMSLYGAAKSFRERFFHCLAIEWTDNQLLPKLCVINYSPGPMDTDMMTQLIANVCNEELSHKMHTMKESGQLIDPFASSEKLFTKILANHSDFESGSRIDFHDV